MTFHDFYSSNNSNTDLNILTSHDTPPPKKKYINILDTLTIQLN